MMTRLEKIRVGDRVRSVDFPGIQEDTYIEGTVEAVGVTRFPGGQPFDCPRYAIRVDRDVWGGKPVESSHRLGQLVYPPVNGTPMLGGGRTACVSKIVTNLDAETENADWPKRREGHNGE